MAFYHDKTKLPFDFTPHIFRYLEKLIDIAENTWADETGDEISIDNYLPGEPKNPEIQLNNGEFWHFLDNIGAIKFSQEKGYGGLKPGMKIEAEIVDNGGVKNFYLSKTYLRILDIKKVKELLTERDKSAIIRTETLELLARDITQHKTGSKLVDLLKRCEVPTKMIVYPNTKWKTLFDAFRVLSTSANQKANRILYKVIEAVVHPLFFDGDKNKATEAQKKYNEWLKYDSIMIEDGKIYIGPTEEEFELGIIELVDADGKEVEPKGIYWASPDHIAQLWVLWSQLIVLVSAYENNQALDQKELEKLYLEVIGKVEELIRRGEIGRLKETYTRPFTSLATAYIEAKAKKAESPSDLVNTFLLEITALNPDPTEVGKEMEKNAELIGGITKATRAIGGKEIKLLELSYEQALFLLKLTAGHIFRILDAVSTGYISFADEQLSAKYVLLSDNLNGLLTRKDFEEIKKELPPDLPKHLFSVEEMDSWWEYGAQSGMTSFIGDVEAAWVRAGQQTFPLPGWMIQYFNEIDETITQHRKNKAMWWDRTEKNIKERKTRGEFSFEPPQEEKKQAVQKIEITNKEFVIRNAEDNTPKGKKEGAYITKEGDDFYYKGRYLKLSKKSDYYKVFCSLYAKLPNGGEVSYKDLIAEVKSRLPKTQNKTDDEMKKFIQRNLTDKSNGFMRYAGIPETEDNGKSLIEVMRGSGIVFNNKTG